MSRLTARPSTEWHESGLHLFGDLGPAIRVEASNGSQQEAVGHQLGGEDSWQKRFLPFWIREDVWITVHAVGLGRNDCSTGESISG